MVANIDWNKFEPVNQPTEGAFDWNKFEPVETAKKTETSEKEHPYSGQYAHLTPSQYEALSKEEKQQLQNYVPLTGVAKGLAKGATLGLSEYIPGMEIKKHEVGAGFGEAIGSILPIGKLYKYIGKPIVNLASKSPYAQKAVQSLGSIMGWGATGATEEALKQSFHGKVPDVEDVLVHGAEWGAIDAALQSLGLGGRFAAGLLGLAKKQSKPTFEVLNNVMNEARASGVDFTQPERVATKALSILEKEKGITERPVQGREISVSKEDFTKVSEKIPEIAEPIKPGKIDSKKATENLAKTVFDESIEQVGPKAKNDLEFGENIKKDIEEQQKIAQQTYEPYYNRVEEFSKFHKVSAPQVEKLVNNILARLEGLKTRPTQYKNVIDTLSNVLEDIGIKDTNLILGGGGKFVIKEPIPMSNLIELGRRLNKIIDYDIVGPSIKNELKPVVKEVKNEIRRNLKKLNPVMEKIFNTAERRYAQTADRFAKDSILKVRGEEAPENIAKMIKNATSIKDLKAVVSPQQFRQIERDILEHIKELSPEKASEYVKQVGDQLSKPTKQLAERIAKSKIPSSRLAQTKAIQNNILTDLGNAFTKGERPSNTLDLWKTKEGQKLIKEALKGTKNEKKVLEYLQKQTLSDMAKTVIKDGKLDFAEFNKLMKDPAFIGNIREIGGESAVTFFKNLENMSKRFSRNLKLLEEGGLRTRTPSGKLEVPEKRITVRGEEMLKKAARKQFPIRFAINKFRESLGVPGKTILGLTGLQYLGVPTGIKAYAAYRVFYKLASSNVARRAFIHTLNYSRIDPKKFILAFNGLEKALSED